MVLVDPPRKGMSQSAIDSVKKINPEKIVYVSCNPSTLARDIALFEPEYNLVKCHAVDMFPRTSHVETVCLLSKLSEVKHSIDVKLDMDELDVTTADK